MASAYNATNADIHTAVTGWCNGTITPVTPINNGTYGHIGTWDTSQVTNMSQLFMGKQQFNDDISNWNVSSVTNMLQMFQTASAFNQNINGWNVSIVTDMRYMFEYAKAFNQPLNLWNVVNVTFYVTNV